MVRSFFLFIFLLALAGCSKRMEETTVVEKIPFRRLAIVITPVCDVLGREPTIHRSGPARYANLPCSLTMNKYSSWLRVHQLIYNQLVYVLKQVGQESQIEVPNLCLKVNPHTKKEPLTGWILTKNILFLDDLPNLSYNAIPDPFHLRSHKAQEYISLISPIYIPKFEQKLSVATNLVVKKQTEEGFICSLLDPSTRQPFDTLIPIDACIKAKQKSLPEKMRTYVSLLRKWANVDGGCIPYVLGGASFTVPYTKTFTQTLVKKGSITWQIYDRKSPSSIHTGMDCTTLIYLAANIAGLNYDLKNTTAIKNSLTPLTRHDQIEVGDIIFYPGHVMVISQIRPLKIIQSRGYGPKVGRVIENKAKDFLKYVETIDDLAHLYFKNKPLIYADYQASHPSWKIYKFSKYVQQ